MKDERLFRSMVIMVVRAWVRAYHTCAHEHRVHPDDAAGQAGAEFLRALGAHTYAPGDRAGACDAFEWSTDSNMVLGPGQGAQPSWKEALVQIRVGTAVILSCSYSIWEFQTAGAIPVESVVVQFAEGRQATYRGVLLPRKVFNRLCAEERELDRLAVVRKPESASGGKQAR